MDYESFKARNASWDDGFAVHYPEYGEELMRRNYDIACRVAEKITKDRQGKDFPVPGDLVEGAKDEFGVFGHGCIEAADSRDMYTICEFPSIHTNGELFSCSGGSFFRRHRSRLVKIGEGEQDFWTWGCHGSGANQGIFFTAVVRKWRLVSEIPQKARSFVRIGPHREGGREIKVELYGERGYIVQSFVTIKAFRLFAEHVGLKYEKETSWCGNGEFRYRCKQKVSDMIVWDEDMLPPNSIPIKAFSNGTLTTCYVYCDDKDFVICRPNCNRKDWCKPVEDAEEYERYFNNPLGVV